MSRSAVETLLRKSPDDRKFIMKTVGMDDSVPADMTLLPTETQEQNFKAYC